MNILESVEFELFTIVTMKNAVFRGVTPCGSYKNRISNEYIVSVIGVHSALVRVNEELLERKVAAPV
jgi:hypothetical protein